MYALPALVDTWKALPSVLVLVPSNPQIPCKVVWAEEPSESFASVFDAVACVVERQCRPMVSRI